MTRLEGESCPGRSAISYDGLTSSDRGVSPYGPIDYARSDRELPYNQCDVAPIHISFSDGTRESLNRLRSAADDHQSRSVRVQAMNDAGAVAWLQVAEFGVPGEQAVDEGSVRPSGAGVDSHTSGFIDDDDVIVIVDDAEIQVLSQRRRVGDGWSGGIELDDITNINVRRWSVDDLSVDCGSPFANQTLNFGAREIWDFVTNEEVQPDR